MVTPYILLRNVYYVGSVQEVYQREAEHDDGPGAPVRICGAAQQNGDCANGRLYIGRLCLDPLRYVKNPDTGKRVSRLNAESAWMRKEVPTCTEATEALRERIDAIALTPEQGALRIEMKGNLAAMLVPPQMRRGRRKPATSRCRFKWLRGLATNIICSSGDRQRKTACQSSNQPLGYSVFIANLAVTATSSIKRVIWTTCFFGLTGPNRGTGSARRSANRVLKVD
jgi:hypothetical protein